MSMSATTARLVMATILLLTAAPTTNAASRRLRAISTENKGITINGEDLIPDITTHSSSSSSRSRDDDESGNLLSPFVDIRSNDDNGGTTVIHTPFVDIITSGSNGTRVSAPGVDVSTSENGTSVTGPFVNVSTGSDNNTFSSDDCQAWSRDDACQSRVKRYFSVLGSQEEDNDDKDEAVDRFCRSTCGTRYTAKVQAILSGLCSNNETTNSTSSESKDVDDVTVEADGSSDINKARSKNSTADDLLLTVRAGASLGCLTDSNGQVCATLTGCDFWKGCCGASLAVAQNKTGSPFSDDVKSNIERLCPGSLTYINGDRSSC